MHSRTLFEKFGHRCEIRTRSEELHTIKSTKVKCLTRVRRYLQQIHTINETNKRCYNFLRSQKKIAYERKKQKEHVFVIHPFSDFRKYWEIIMIIVLLAQMTMVPLDMATHHLHFKEMFTESIYFTIGRITTSAICCVDIIFSFLTGYCEKRNTQLRPSKIARHYLRTTFVLDVLCSIPIDVIEITIFKMNALAIPLSFLVINSVIKFSRFFVFVRYSRHFFESSELSFILLRLWIGMVGLLMYLHVLTCVAITANKFEQPHNLKSIYEYYFNIGYGHGIESLSHYYLLFLYNTCHFIASSNFVMRPNTDYMLISMVIAWIISKIFYIVVIAYFMELYSAVTSSKQKFIDVLNEVKDYMQHRQIPKFLQLRVLSFYEIKFQNYYFQESEVLNTVSGQIRQEIIMYTCKKLVENVTFFRNLPLSLLVRIVSCLHYELYLTNDVITKYGTHGESMYFILSGTVGVYTKTGKEICHLHDGDHFGEIALMMNKSKRVASVIAAEVCELYRLDHKDFVRAILPYPDLFEKIRYVAGERVERTKILDEAALHKSSQHYIFPQEM